MIFNYRYFINIALLLWGCITCLIIALCLFLSKNYNQKRRNLLLRMQVYTALLLFSDSLAWFFRGASGTSGYYMVRISNFIVFATTVIILFVFHKYVCSHLFSSEETKEIKRVTAGYIVCILAVSLVILNVFTNLYYYFDNNNLYHRNSAYVISMLLPLSCMLIDSSLLIQYKNRISKRALWAMLSYIILPVSASAIQIFHYGFSLINFGICCSMILMYIVITGEQNEKLGQLAQDKKELSAKLEIASILNRCTKELSSNKPVDEAIYNLLQTVNDYFDADRTYIFQTDYTRQIVINTYEYTLENVTQEMNNLQGVPLSVISRWMDEFQKGNAYYIPELKQEKGTPTYAMLQEQNVERLLAVPLLENEKIIGFLGVDNPRNHYDDATLLSSIQFFVTSSLRRKKEQEYLSYLSYRDMLTHLYNRNKYTELLASYNHQQLTDTGVAYIDLNGLKKVNDTQGHSAGDVLIKTAASVIQELFPEDAYRIGGDEFVIISTYIGENLFYDNITLLRQKMKEHKVSVSIGIVWQETVSDLKEVLHQADYNMYSEKQTLYQSDNNHNNDYNE